MSNLVRGNNGAQELMIIENNDHEDFDPIENEERKQMPATTGRKMRQLKFLDSDGIKTLEKEEKLDYREYDTQH